MKTFFLSALAIFILSSCSKQDVDLPSAYFNIEINGDEYSLDPSTFSVRIENGVIYSGENNVAGIVSGINFPQGSVIREGIYVLSQDIAKIYFGFTKRGTVIYYDSEKFNNSESPVYELHIDKVTDYYIQGTFKGNYMVNHKYGDIIPVPKGSFLFHK